MICTLRFREYFMKQLLENKIMSEPTHISKIIPGILQMAVLKQDERSDKMSADNRIRIKGFLEKVGKRMVKELDLKNANT